MDAALGDVDAVLLEPPPDAATTTITAATTTTAMTAMMELRLGMEIDSCC